MIITLLGLNGSGKGFISSLLEKKGFIHISTGDILRSEVNNDTKIGKKIKDSMSGGGLANISDSDLVDLIKDKIKEDNENIIFDGFPRTVNQAKLLYKMLAKAGKSLDYAIYLDVDKDIIIDRLKNRVICKDCGAVYNEKTDPPKKAGICDKCGGGLIHREDDEEEVIKERFKTYEKKTAGLIDFYKEKGLLKTVDGKDAKKAIEEIMELPDTKDEKYSRNVDFMAYRDYEIFESWMDLRSRIARHKTPLVTNVIRRQASKKAWTNNRFKYEHAIKRFWKSPAGRRLSTRMSKYAKDGRYKGRAKGTTGAQFKVFDSFSDFQSFSPIAMIAMAEHMSWLISQNDYEINSEVFQMQEIMGHVAENPEIFEDIINEGDWGNE